MREEILYELHSPYRESLKVHGFYFGQGTKTACIVGALRGNEVQQMYVCARLIEALKKLEADGAIAEGQEILVIPSVNHASMNIGKRFWPIDDTDINRMFPGYNLGETTQRIAAGLFDNIKGYQYGIQLTSFYMMGEIIPHVRILDLGYHNIELAKAFGMPYVMLRKPRPYDSTTLNYNWQVWASNAFSLYTTHTEEFDTPEAMRMVDHILGFLNHCGVLKYRKRPGYASHVVTDKNLVTVQTGISGLYRYFRNPGEVVHKGDLLAQVLDPFDASIREELFSPVDGTVFFRQKSHLINQNAVAFRLLEEHDGIV